MTECYREDYKILYYAHSQNLFHCNTLPWISTDNRSLTRDMEKQIGFHKGFGTQWGNGDVSDTKYIIQAS